MATKGSQINLRLPEELDSWVEAQAGGKRQKPAFIRQLIEREKARGEEEELVAMFNAAWDGLTEAERGEERAERGRWFEAYAGHEDP